MRLTTLSRRGLIINFVVGLAVQYSPGAWSVPTLLGSIPPVLVAAAVGYAVLGTLAALIGRVGRMKEPDGG